MIRHTPLCIPAVEQFTWFAFPVISTVKACIYAMSYQFITWNICFPHGIMVNNYFPLLLITKKKLIIFLDYSLIEIPRVFKDYGCLTTFDKRLFFLMRHNHIYIYIWTLIRRYDLNQLLNRHKMRLRWLRLT